MIAKRIKLYLSSAIIYGGGYFAITQIPTYQTLLNEDTYQYLLYFLIAFLLVSPIYYLSIKHVGENKPYLFLRMLGKLVKKKTITEDEKTAARFLLVKIFFLPVMLQFFVGNAGWIQENYKTATLFAFLLTLIFAIDTGVFFFSYSFEFETLKNKVKSVEPTFFGWFVALICYPPFNHIVGNRIEWGANDYALFWSPTITNAFRVLIIALFLIYLAATISLGPKASNLTNRGIVSRFPYSIVRHPAYISKNLVWWLTLLPVMTWPFAIGMGFWTMIYFFRAWTEERHLSMDPDYLEYKKKVKWMFIPYII